MEKRKGSPLLFCYAFELIHMIHNLRRTRCHSVSGNAKRLLSLSYLKGGRASRHTASRDAVKFKSTKNQRRFNRYLNVFYYVSTNRMARSGKHYSIQIICLPLRAMRSCKFQQKCCGLFQKPSEKPNTNKQENCFVQFGARRKNAKLTCSHALRLVILICHTLLPSRKLCRILDLCKES